MIQVDRVSAQDCDEAGRLAFEAFKDIADRHGFPPEFKSIHEARASARWLTSQEPVLGFAVRRRALEGVAYLSMIDEVAGIGPVAVDLSAQGQGTGRILMQACLDAAVKHGHTRVRLMQDAFNVGSLGLYASLGFQVVEPLAIVATPPATAALAIREADDEDLAELCRLYRERVGFDRSGEIHLAQRYRRSLLIEKGDQIAGFVAGYSLSKAEFGFADDNETLVTIVAGQAALKGAPVQWMLPMRHDGLLNAAIRAGSTVVKMGNLMAFGPYEAPSAPHIVSFWY